MTWARALGEFGATIMFAGNVEGRTQTLPLVVYSEFQGGDLDASVAAAAILVLAAFGVLVAVRVFRWGSGPRHCVPIVRDVPRTCRRRIPTGRSASMKLSARNQLPGRSRR